eukprot:SAG31_NODE_29773_length_390_cov_0.704467_1_plen_34_part_10
MASVRSYVVGPGVLVPGKVAVGRSHFRFLSEEQH